MDIHTVRAQAEGLLLPAQTFYQIREQQRVQQQRVNAAYDQERNDQLCSQQLHNVNLIIMREIKSFIIRTP